MCAVWEGSYMHSVDDVRYAFFQQHYAPKSLVQMNLTMNGVNYTKGIQA